MGAEIAESDSQLGTNHNTMTWLRPGSTSDWTTLPSYIYRVVKHLPMQWMHIWMHSYFIKAMEVGSAGKIWLTTGYKTYNFNYDLV